MSKEILLVVESVSNEKGVSEDIIFDALESALATAAKKRYSEEVELRVAVDKSSGEYETFRWWGVIDDDEEKEFPGAQMTLGEAKEKDPSLEVGDRYEIPAKSVEFGRIAAQTAKQVIVQKVREAERAQVVDAYKGRVGEMLSGQVKKTTRDMVIVDLGNNAEAVLTKDDWIPKEKFQIGDRVRGLLQDIRSDVRGPQLTLTRTSNAMLIELFKIEVPEVADGIIEILGCARIPGSRAKIAVKTNDGRIDPVGACVGMRGSRVQAVSGELGNERIDVIPWDDNVLQLVINAMSPANVASVFMDDDKHSADIAVSEDDVKVAKGVAGQNVRLASELTGLNLNILNEEQYREKREAASITVLERFMEQLDVDEDVALVLYQEGFTTLEEVAYVAIEEMMAIDVFDEEIVKELRSRARNAVATLELAGAESPGSAEPAEDLLSMDGMDIRLAYRLADKGIVTMEDLAEQAIDDLLEIQKMTEERAGELIMTARAPWFEAESEAVETGQE